MKRLRKILFFALMVGVLACLCCQPAFAAVSEEEVQAQVDAVGKEAVSGNVLIWFMCAIGFLKVSQKIDSFMAGLGVNVGHTGGSMLAEANQLDERYASQPYGTDNIGGYGCGPTSMAIVVSSLTDDTVDPVEMAQWSYENGYWCKSSGSYHALIPAAAEAWGLPVSGCTTAEPQRIVDALSEGKLVVAIMSKGHFTSSGHFIVLRGVKNGQIMVADPASYKRSEQLWDLSIILNEASRRAGAGGPFWIIG